MARTKGNVPYTVSFEPFTALPVDARTVVPFKADLQDITNAYDGLIVYVDQSGVKECYICIDKASVPNSSPEGVVDPTVWKKIPSETGTTATLWEVNGLTLISPEDDKNLLIEGGSIHLLNDGSASGSRISLQHDDSNAYYDWETGNHYWRFDNGVGLSEKMRLETDGDLVITGNLTVPATKKVDAGYFDADVGDSAAAGYGFGGVSTAEAGLQYTSSSELTLRSGGNVIVNLDEGTPDDHYFSVKNSSDSQVFSVTEAGYTSTTGDLFVAGNSIYLKGSADSVAPRVRLHHDSSHAYHDWETGNHYWRYDTTEKMRLQSDGQLVLTDSLIVPSGKVVDAGHFQADSGSGTTHGYRFDGYYPNILGLQYSSSTLELKSPANVSITIDSDEGTNDSGNCEFKILSGVGTELFSINEASAATVGLSVRSGTFTADSGLDNGYRFSFSTGSSNACLEYSVTQSTEKMYLRSGVNAYVTLDGNDVGGSEFGIEDGAGARAFTVTQTGDTTVEGDLTVEGEFVGDLTLSGDLTVPGDLILEGGIDGTNDSQPTHPVEFSGHLNVEGNLSGNRVSAGTDIVALNNLEAGGKIICYGMVGLSYTDGVEIQNPGPSPYTNPQPHWNIINRGTSGLLYFARGGVNTAHIAPTPVGQLGDQVHPSFTGQHLNTPDASVNASHVGCIVVSTGEYNNLSMTSDIKINEGLPKVSLSTARKQKNVFGVVSDEEDENNREYSSGSFVSTYEKPDNDPRLMINSLGEGGIWVCSINGDLENGDYITSCEIPGFGMKQDDDLLHNYTVAKITCDCNFDLNSTVYQCVEFDSGGTTYKKAFVGCTYHCG